MVFYRKYRPQTISQLDSGTLRETLTAVLSRPEIPHAFLLTGPKGLGKTSTARIIAKVVNCMHTVNNPERSEGSHGNKKIASLSERSESKGSSLEPDNTCDQCISITNGSNMDVLEIDGASNRGIDEIRDLRDKVKLAPSRAKKKIYIIDEVHMLTTEAFNALLKTIEEPPSHVMFIFCTTEPQKVPATILSRCSHVQYTRATEDDLVRSFQRIVAGEKIAIAKEALHMIARLADGGFRDGTKILEELVTRANGQKITEEFVEEHYHVSSISYGVSRMLEFLSEGKAKESLELVGKIVEQGIDIKYFISQILETLHETLLENIGIRFSPISYKPLAISISDIQTLVRLFSEAYRETKYAVIPQLPLELAVIAWCSSSVIPAKAGIQENHSEFISGSGSRIVTSPMTTTGQGKSGMTIDSLRFKEKNLKVQSILRGSEIQSGKAVKKESNSSQETLSDKTTTEQFMENLIYKVKPLNFSIAGVLRGCTVKKLADGEVILETSYKFHREKLDESKTRAIIEKAIKEITGKELQVVVELTKESKI